VVVEGIRKWRGHRGRPTGTARANSEPLLGLEEARRLVARMDAGDFDFDEDTVRRMREAWQVDNGAVPYPSILTSAYASGDAIAMNSVELMEVSYQLPYSLAYEETQREKYQHFIGAMSEVGVDFRNATVADVGCGYGGLLEIVREMHPSTRLVGIECASSAIRCIERHRPHIRGIVGDLTGPDDALRAAVGEADIVICTEVLEHLLDPGLALRNLLALRATRAIGMTVPNGRVDTAAQHINFWSPESWRAFIVAGRGDHDISTGKCLSPGSPGGFDNFAVLKSRQGITQ
jgi:2-polyprenyl-3-methyl-5-hydroxy-6-metoxy-1,4-benzoquinol methylase